MKQKYDIFISYRRDGGLELADSIYQRLINAGYSVFIDLEQLNSGRFNEKLLTVIENCTDFILVLPPNALDRCSDADDWVRLEIEHAKKHNKNI
ncbi:MAG: toll/interleukin-1 receptor domain-containing protein, partial [Muribaculaceae bacterium]|nr:toll/interleukin-1 receptor domain-containing protein [Muribaculaceae bacterium]